MHVLCPGVAPLASGVFPAQPGPLAQLRAAWAAQLQRLWHFSEAARHFPGYLHVPNVVQYVDLVVQAGPPGVLGMGLGKQEGKYQSIFADIFIAIVLRAECSCI